jgi:hypothetical protein
MFVEAVSGGSVASVVASVVGYFLCSLPRTFTH